MNASGHAMRVCAAIFASATVLFGCAPGPGFLAPDDTPQSAYGSFLAARYANTARNVEQSARLYADALSFEPDSTLISERAFLVSLMAGDFARADEAAQAAAGDADAIALIGLYIDAARLSGARIEATTSSQGTDGFSDLVRAVIAHWALVDQGRVSEAVDASGRIESPFAAAGQVMVHRALLFERAGRHERAETLYRAAHAGLDMPDYTAVLLGAFLERRGRSREAEALYRQRIEAGGAPPDPEIAAALARVTAGERAPRRPRAAQAAAQALFAPAALLTRQAPVDYSALFLRLIERLDPDFQRNTFALAEILKGLELQAAALAAYESLDEGPFSGRAGVQAAWLTFRSGRQEEALAQARALINADGSESTRLVLADMLRASDQCAQAAPIYEQVAAARQRAGLDPDWRHAYYAGVCRQRSQGWAAAEPHLLRALEIAPDEPRVLNHLGYNWIVLETRVEEGFELVRRAAELAPENGAVLDSLGWGHFKQGRVAEAVRWLEDAVSRSPENPTINWHLGDAYAAAGRSLEAQFQWRRTLELDPDPRERDLVRRRLEQGLEAGPEDLE